jgi:hypothetical protein
MEANVGEGEYDEIRRIWTQQWAWRTYPDVEHVSGEHRGRVEHLPHGVEWLAAELGHLELPAGHAVVRVDADSGCLVELDPVRSGHL